MEPRSRSRHRPKTQSDVTFEKLSKKVVEFSRSERVVGEQFVPAQAPVEAYYQQLPAARARIPAQAPAQVARPEIPRQGPRQPVVYQPVQWLSEEEDYAAPQRLGERLIVPAPRRLPEIDPPLPRDRFDRPPRPAPNLNPARNQADDLEAAIFRLDQLVMERQPALVQEANLYEIRLANLAAAAPRPAAVRANNRRSPVIAQAPVAVRNDGPIRKPIEGGCYICYEEFEDQEDPSWCRACGQNVHEECLRAWRQTRGANVRCPYCRAPWREN